MYDPYNLSVFFKWAFESSDLRIAALVILGVLVYIRLLMPHKSTDIRDTDWYKAFHDKNDDDFED